MRHAVTFMLAAIAVSQTPSTARTVVTRAGPINGVSEADLDVYRGIPYAAAPIGELRWQKPQPHPAWNAPHEAFRNAPACPQDMSMLVSMGEAPLPISEDCLYLNVWSPKALGRPLPVMIWIHGGAFTTGGTGAAMFNSAQLARKGVVVVTVGYRLGALGFPAKDNPDGSVSGNFGLQDQIAALRWVRANFGSRGGAEHGIPEIA